MLSRRLFQELDAYCQTFAPDFRAGADYPAIFSHWCAAPDLLPPGMPRGVWEALRERLLSAPLTLGEADSDDAAEATLPGFPGPYVPHDGGEARFSFIDLFAGIGGFHLAMAAVGGRCVFASEWDRFAQETYWHNFGLMPFGDIRKIPAADIPDHDVLCADFPSQPFSLAGVSKKNALGRTHGFADTSQGTLLFDVCRIIAAKRPKAFFLINVKSLLTHDKGRTFQEARAALDALEGYFWTYQVVDGKAWVPQHWESVFIVGFDRAAVPDERCAAFRVPTAPSRGHVRKRLAQIVRQDITNADHHTIGDGTWATLQRHKAHHRRAGNGFGYRLHTFPLADDETTRTLSARYHKDGAEILFAQPGKNPRRLTVEEAMQLQGYDPACFRIPVSRTQAYRQLGNSLVVPAVTETARAIAEALRF